MVRCEFYFRAPQTLRTACRSRAHKVPWLFASKIKRNCNSSSPNAHKTETVVDLLRTQRHQYVNQASGGGGGGGDGGGGGAAAAAGGRGWWWWGGLGGGGGGGGGSGGGGGGGGGDNGGGDNG